jgi:hypothetical protein
MGVPAPLPNQDRTGLQYSGGIKGIVITTGPIRRRLAAPRLSGVVRLGAVEEVAGDTRSGANFRSGRSSRLIE